MDERTAYLMGAVILLAFGVFMAAAVWVAGVVGL